MDPTFNEANLGYGQFRTWLEDNNDLVNLFFKDLQMYVAPVEFDIPEGFAVTVKAQERHKEKPVPAVRTNLADAYASVFSKVIGVETETRRDVLRDVYRELSKRPGEWTFGTLLDELQSRYEAKGLAYSKILLRKVLQLGFHQQAYEYLGSVSIKTPIKLVEDLESQATFIRRAESRFPYAVIQADLETDLAEMAAILLDDRTQIGYIQELLDDLDQRGLIMQVDRGYRLLGHSENPLRDDLNLKDIIRELETVQLPENLGRDVTTAEELAKSAMAKRTQDFTAAAQDILLACRLQWEAFERKDPEATLEELRWYIASYASVKAGELAQVYGRYAAAQPYYLAFFSLVQEDTLLWNRMRKLINPMLSFYWRNLAYEIGVKLEYTTLPVKIAIQMAFHANLALREKWQKATEKLASVNPYVLRRVANSIRLAQEDSQVNILVAEQIERMLDIQ
jgi:hypothetical protein